MGTILRNWWDCGCWWKCCSGQWVENKDKEGGKEDESCWLWAEEDDEEESGDDIEKLVGLWMLVEVL